MISVKHLFVLNKPKANLPYVGKVTKEMNSRQNYNSLYKKPFELQKKLPLPKHSTPINQE